MFIRNLDPVDQEHCLVQDGEVEEQLKNYFGSPECKNLNYVIAGDFNSRMSIGYNPRRVIVNNRRHNPPEIEFPLFDLDISTPFHCIDNIIFMNKINPMG